MVSSARPKVSYPPPVSAQAPSAVILIRATNFVPNPLTAADNAFQSEVHRRFLIPLCQGLDLRLHPRDVLAHSRRSGCLLHERQQGELTVWHRQATLGFDQAIPLGRVFLTQVRQLSDVFLLANGLTLQTTQC